jgi:putative component of membrane protein insertase Oxa1/YidC/SpoIIIJ protein YidD
VIAIVMAALVADSGAGLLFDAYRLLASGPLGRTCVFTPSCSHYAEEAIGEWGPLLGIPAALDRWTRCHPGARGEGYPRVLVMSGDRSLWRLSDPVDGSGPEVVPWGRYLLPF